MTSLFSGPKMPAQKLPTPGATRAPRETDPAILEAAKRTRTAGMRRRGRMSTIMTENTGSNVVGSSGKSLGA